MIGPELGVTQPGMTIVCGDSHTSTHGAFGSLAFGIGTSEVEHVLATQTLVQRRPHTMRITYQGELGIGCTAKDMILGTIAQIGTDGAAGHVVEYTGEAIRRLSMEGRMTIANMSIEAGAKGGMMAADDTTFAYLEGRPGVPEDFDAACHRWADLRTDDGRIVRPRGRCGRPGAGAAGVVGYEPRAGGADRRRRAGAARRGRRACARLHGSASRHADGRDRHRPRLPGLLHQRPDRGPARRRPGRARPQGRGGRPGDGRARIRTH